MVVLELSFSSESSEPFCTQFMKLTSLQIQCFPAAFPCETSHKSLVVVGHCLLVATLFSYLINFYKGIRLSPERSCLWGWKEFRGLSKNNKCICHQGLPSVSTRIFLYLAYGVWTNSSALVRMGGIWLDQVFVGMAPALFWGKWRGRFWSGCLVGGPGWHNP